MKVSDHNPPIQLDAYVRQVQQQQQKSEDVKSSIQGAYGGADRVELSDHAQKALQASQQVNPTTAGHEDKVHQVQLEVDQGTYKVPAARIATDMLKESFENDIILQKINALAENQHTGIARGEERSP